MSILIPGTSFQMASGHVKRRLICSISGMEKTGKSHQAFLAPDPIYYFSFDCGDEGVIDKFLLPPYNKQIAVAEYLSPKSDVDQVDWLGIWLRFKKEFEAAVKAAGSGSVIVDTETECWAVARMARFGKLSQVMPDNYDKLNAEMLHLIRLGYESSASVIFLRKMGAVFENRQRTDRFEPKGFGGLVYAVQSNLRVWRDEEWHLFIIDCRQNMKLAGIDLVGPMADLGLVIRDMVFAGVT